MDRAREMVLEDERITDIYFLSELVSQSGVDDSGNPELDRGPHILQSLYILIVSELLLSCCNYVWSYSALEHISQTASQYKCQISRTLGEVVAKFN